VAIEEQLPRIYKVKFEQVGWIKARDLVKVDLTGDFVPSEVRGHSGFLEIEVQ
jgi:hypothetical protein